MYELSPSGRIFNSVNNSVDILSIWEMSANSIQLLVCSKLKYLVHVIKVDHDILFLFCFILHVFIFYLKFQC